MLNKLKGKKAIILAGIFTVITAVFIIFSEDKNAALQPLSAVNKTEKQDKVNLYEKKSKTLHKTSAFLMNSPGGNTGKLHMVSDYEAHSAFGPMPEYMSGIAIDGGFDTDDDGNLVISYNNRLLFDFFLSTVNIEGKELCAERIREYIHLTLPGKAADQALRLFESYLGYKGRLNDFYKDVDEININESNPEKHFILKNTLDQMIRFRREILGDKVADAFFRDEEAILNYTITAMKNSSEQDLSETEKENNRAEARNNLPEAILEDISEYEEEQKFIKTIAQLKTSTENSDRIFMLRAQRYGTRSAERLESLDNKRLKLKERYQSFCSEVKNNPGYSHLSETELADKINELKKSEFKEWELAHLSTVQH